MDLALLKGPFTLIESECKSDFTSRCFVREYNLLVI